jgi:hypothetical protein
MTTVERLIKNICEQQRQRILNERDAELSEFKSEIPFRKAPVAVRNAFKNLIRLNRQEKHARKVIERHGFRVGYGHEDSIPDALDVDTRLADKKKHSLREDCDSRLQQLENLRTTAYVQALGKTPEKARSILTELQRKVAKL